MKQLSNLIIFCDGASRGNPGLSSSAFVAVDDQEQIVYQQGKFLGITTNNVAEYHAVLLALNWLLTLVPSPYPLSPTINLDSELLYKQITGKYKIKAPHLIPLMHQIHQLLTDLKHQNLIIKFQHQLRSHNHQADALCNQILDQQSTS